MSDPSSSSDPNSSDPNSVGDPVEEGARAAARRLTTPALPGLADQVEIALYARTAENQPVQYGDVIALGSLLVSIATFAWTVYNDRRNRGATPPAEVVVRHVRQELTRSGIPVGALDPAERDRIIEVTVAETLTAARADAVDGPGQPPGPGDGPGPG